MSRAALSMSLALICLGALLSGCVLEMAAPPVSTQTSGGVAGEGVAAEPDAAEPNPGERAVLEDGLYVNGLVLRPDGSQAKILESLGTEDERYEAGPVIVNYVWYFADGSALTVGFTDSGSLWSGTLANLTERAHDDSTFAVLHGERVSTGDTLASVAAKFPSGEKGEVDSMEGFSFLDYTVRFGPEGSLRMVFSVDWGFEDDPADPMDLPLGSISIESW